MGIKTHKPPISPTPYKPDVGFSAALALAYGIGYISPQNVSRARKVIFNAEHSVMDLLLHAVAEVLKMTFEVGFSVMTMCTFPLRHVVDIAAGHRTRGALFDFSFWLSECTFGLGARMKHCLCFCMYSESHLSTGHLSAYTSF